jgi:hypothetical protein
VPNLSDWINELKACADVVNEAARALLARDVESMQDVEWFTPALIAKNNRVGLPEDQGLDTRIAWQSVAAATWLRNGGTRFCPSESVAASLILTRQQPGTIHLPYQTQLLHLPVGFMPSPVVGEYEGMILIARLTPSQIYTISCTRREGSYATRVMVFDDGVDEAEVKAAVAGVNGISPGTLLAALADVRSGIPATSQESFESSAAMTIRIVRNFASWISAFPVRPSPDRRGTIGNGEVGGSLAIGPMVYLKTEVQMAPEMRTAAKTLVRMDADYAVRKLALRHIVRGHWKRQVIKDGRKTIWVAPYWRGPDGPAAWGRVYKMRTSEMPC